MTRLLIFEPSYDRIAATLATHGDRLEPLLMRQDGSITRDGEAVGADDALPEAAWFNNALFESGAAREFMIALLKAPGLKWLQSAAAGFDHPVFEQLAKRGVRLTTSHGQAVGMADFVVAGVLDHFQNGPLRRAAQAEKAWRRIAFREVLASRWVVVGFGAIGQGVAQRAKAFGAHVVGIRRNPAPHPCADEIAPLSRLIEFAPAADAIVLCAPLTKATRHIANAELFAAMKSGSVIVNVGRGGSLDEAALVEALDRGAPERAVLDVFDEEPLPSESPLWDHPAVSVTAHASGATAGQDPRNEALFVENLERYLAGEALLHEVDPADILSG